MSNSSSSLPNYVCRCDACGMSEPLTLKEVYSISSRGDLPRNERDVYMLMCQSKFVKLYTDHGNKIDDVALKTSHLMAVAHLLYRGLIAIGAAQKPRSNLRRLANAIGVCSLIFTAYLLSAAPIKARWGTDHPPNAVDRAYAPATWLSDRSPFNKVLIPWASLCDRILKPGPPAASQSQQTLQSETPRAAVTDGPAGPSDRLESAPPNVAPAEFRTWTDQRGRTVEAKLIGTTEGKVTFELRSGQSATVDIEKLSETDHLYIKQMGSAASSD